MHKQTPGSLQSITIRRPKSAYKAVSSASARTYEGASKYINRHPVHSKHNVRAPHKSAYKAGLVIMISNSRL